MKPYLCLSLLLAATGCSKPAQPAIHNVAANRMSNEDVTDVPDESADDNAGGGNNSVDPD